MSDEIQSLRSRIELVERKHARLRVALIAFVVVALALTIWTVRFDTRRSTDPLRVRGLIVEDVSGRERIILGVLDGRGRVGLQVNDPAGAERLGMSLQPNGSMVLGLDAPPGKGDGRNRERITLAADQHGGAHIRFLDRRTSVAARMYLDDRNQVWMEFSDFVQRPPLRRRMGLLGEDTTQTGQ
jgi:hypothetical protein